MNERIRELIKQSGLDYDELWKKDQLAVDKFSELIVKEMCGLMEQAADDAYHCFEPSERPAEYIEWLQHWQERFENHFGVEK